MNFKFKNDFIIYIIQIIYPKFSPNPSLFQFYHPRRNVLFQFIGLTDVVFPEIKPGDLNVDELYDVSLSRGTKADIVSRKFVIVCLKIVFICLKSMALKKSSQFIIPFDIV